MGVFKFKKEKNVNILKFKYLLEDFKQSKNQASAAEICNMIIDGLLKITASSKDNILRFISASRYSSKCFKCGERYAVGDAIFTQNQKAWHIKCASKEDFKQQHFIDCVERGLVDDISMEDLEKVEKENNV